MSYLKVLGCWRLKYSQIRLHANCGYNGFMRSIFVVLFAANVLLFGLGQGWFGPVQVEPGRDPAILKTQLNAEALQVAFDSAALSQ